MQISSPLQQFKTAAAVFAFTFLAGLGFVLYTGHAWEDYYITFRSSKNLVLGHGLVFTPGERVHSFTSPLGVLLPAAASALTGARSDDAALWAFRFMSLAALAAGMTLLQAALRRLGAGPVVALLATAFAACEGKILDFSTNGMETGVLLFFVAYAFWALAPDVTHRWIHLGVAWAGIMWTRPDGFITIGLLGGGWWLFNLFKVPPRESARLGWLLVRAGLVCTALYLPWLLWASWYYGTPIPHTITAKGSVAPGKTVFGYLTTFAQLPFGIWFGKTTVEGALLPAYFQPAGWHPAFYALARFFGTVATVAWLWPRLSAPTRAASLAFHGTQAYLTYFPYYPFPWYFPVTGLLGAMAWGGVLQHLWELRRGARWLRPLTVALAVLVLAGELVLAGATAIQMEAKQRINYTGNLRRIGEWLHAHAKPTDRVFLEPLGYIGYFSQLPTYDFPGLSSPTMVAMRKNLNNWSGLIRELTPAWLVLRPPEQAAIERENPELLRRLYEPAAVFDVRAEADAARAPDHFMLAFDSRFTVFRRRQPAIAREQIEGVQQLFGQEFPVDLIGDAAVRLVHAPGTMVLRIPPGSTAASLTFGYAPAAYEGPEPTDGAEFRVIWADGPRQVELFSRTVDPASRPEDRGVLTFSGPLPEPARGQARLLLNIRSRATPNKDWTFWGGAEFR